MATAWWERVQGVGFASSPGVSNRMHGCCFLGSSEATGSLELFL